MRKSNLESLWVKRTLSVCLIALIFGCQSVPTNIAAPKPKPSLGGQFNPLESGRATYVSLFKCAMCHRPKPVSDYSPETWEKDILPRMAKKARLKPAEYANVLAYVTSDEARQPR